MISVDVDGLGGNDYLSLGEGNNIGIGGPADDELEAGSGMDILFGDSAEILYFADMSFPMSLNTIGT